MVLGVNNPDLPLPASFLLVNHESILNSDMIKDSLLTHTKQTWHRRLRQLSGPARGSKNQNTNSLKEHLFLSAGAPNLETLNCYSAHGLCGLFPDN